MVVAGAPKVTGSNVHDPAWTVTLGTMMPLAIVKLNAVEPAPEAEAVTVKVPPVPLDVKAGEVAVPPEVVMAVAEVRPPVNVAPDPFIGLIVNVTVTPDIGSPAESVTLATSGAANGWPTPALWPDPETARIAVGDPMFVKTKLV